MRDVWHHAMGITAAVLLVAGGAAYRDVLALTVGAAALFSVLAVALADRRKTPEEQDSPRWPDDPPVSWLH